VLSNHFIDTKNVAYDMEINRETTWDYKDWVDMKKKRRVVQKFVKPSLKNLEKRQSIHAFERNRKKGNIKSNRVILRPY
jgi:hypothetical protein